MTYHAAPLLTFNQVACLQAQARYGRFVKFVMVMTAMLMYNVYV